MADNRSLWSSTPPTDVMPVAEGPQQGSSMVGNMIRALLTPSGPQEPPPQLSAADQAAMMPETFANPLVKKKMEDVARLMAVPGQALRSESPINTAEMLEPAREMAKQFGFIGVPMGMARSGTSAGMFGGKLSSTADWKALQEAKFMASKNVPHERVVQDTGWHRHPADFEWRNEIPDNKAALRYMPWGHGDRAMGTVESLISHPELLRGYPDLGKLKVNITRETHPNFPKGRGMITSNPKTGLYDTIHINAPDMQTGRSVALHELQHAVQQKEGFTPGTEPEWYAALLEKANKDKPYDFTKIGKEAYDRYNKTSGEVEARNVQKRADYSPIQRVTQAPWMTHDVPYLDQYAINPNTYAVMALRDKFGK